MSAYQLYHLQVVDPSLSEQEMQKWRDIFTRADMTSTGLINVSNFGDFKANPRDASPV